ncbi:MAG TPA: HEPN domain-containing protein [Planctomycetes bacterium]|nr:HEPN domain-containing protein [Planctomycetota bacterium]HIJ70156.1 HEPN domain-containing protein [Planctomycetota bacterium]
MTKGQEDLIRYKLGRASESLAEAEVMLQTDHPHGCANRIYYACFYAVTALLLTRDLSSSKHSGVIALFNQHFVKPGLVSVDMGKFYSRMFDNRIESDYADWVEPAGQDLSSEISRAEEFVDQVTTLIETQFK